MPDVPSWHVAAKQGGVIMPRGPRRICANAVVNVTARGNNKKIIFKKEKDYIYFKNLLSKYKAIHSLKIYHYCLMRNHLHLLLKIFSPMSLSRAMQGLQLAYFYYFEKRYGYVGRFWQGRFHSKLIEDDSYLLTAGLYTERNPVRARLVENPAQYKWSSYRVYAYGVKDSLIDLDPHYLSLNSAEKERERIYREIMQGYLDAENDALQPLSI